MYPFSNLSKWAFLSSLVSGIKANYLGSFSSTFKETRPKSHFTESSHTSPPHSILERLQLNLLLRNLRNLLFLFHCHFLMFPEVVNQYNRDNQKKVAADHWVLTQDFKLMELPSHLPCPLKQEHQGAKPEGSSVSLLIEIRTISKWASYLLALRLWLTTNDGEFFLRRRLWTLPMDQKHEEKKQKIPPLRWYHWYCPQFILGKKSHRSPSHKLTEWRNTSLVYHNSYDLVITQ